ncbi:MAG: hypothetical protein QME66_01055 [Candidatus Eisenbacteria bacterium]|nr:hypothetical protein [Candidatus Eisenbacteria bacterium]
MNLRRALLIGLVAGLVMGFALFLTGAMASRVVYGPQLAPEGKFEPEKLNAWYFLWTKLVIGAVFGMLVAVFYGKLPLSTRIQGGLSGAKYAFGLWVIVSVWSLSHRVAYETLETQNQIFWLLYTLGGFLGLGFGFGRALKRWGYRASTGSEVTKNVKLALRAVAMSQPSHAPDSRPLLTARRSPDYAPRSQGYRAMSFLDHLDCKSKKAEQADPGNRVSPCA